MDVDAPGEGPPIVLLHSSGLSGRQWFRLSRELAPRYRVLAPDFLGSGANPPWPADVPFHFQQDVDAIERLLAPLGDVHLVGHSYGGFLAAVIARRRPERVRSLALYDPVVFGVVHDARDAVGLADLARADEPRFLDPVTGGDDAWMEGFVDYWNGDGAWRALPEPTRRAMLRVGKKVFGEVTTLLQDRTPRAAYAAIEAPVLLMTGERSPPAAQRAVALLAEAIPRARARSIPGAGHMGPMTHFAVVNALIADHLDAAR